MYVDRDQKVLYLAHPRTASVATAHALMRSGFSKIVPGDHHSTIDQIPEVLEQREDWTVVTAVRNHWDTIVSWCGRKFRRQMGKDLEWKPSIQDLELLYTANPWIKDNRLFWLHLDHSDEIIRYENGIQEEVDRIFSSFGYTIDVCYDNITPSRHKRPYQEFYNKETREWVLNKFKKEIKDLGYEYGK